MTSLHGKRENSDSNSSNKKKICNDKCQCSKLQNNNIECYIDNIQSTGIECSCGKVKYISFFYIKKTNILYKPHCGSFELVPEVSDYFKKTNGEEFNPINFSRCIPSGRRDKRILDIIEKFGDKTCIDCILSIIYIRYDMLSFFKLSCDLNTGEEQLVFLENKYKDFIENRNIFYFLKKNLYANDMTHDSIVRILIKELYTKSGNLEYNDCNISYNSLMTILASNIPDKHKIFQLQGIIKFTMK